MNKLLKNTWVKMAGVLLFTILMTATAFFATAVVVLEAGGAYANDEAALTEHIIGTKACRQAEDILSNNVTWYDYDGKDAEYNVEGIKSAVQSQENSGFFYTIKDEKGKTVFSNYDKNQEYTYSYQYDGWVSSAKIYVNTETVGPSKAKSLEAFAHTAYSQKTAVIFYAVISFVLAIFVFAFLVKGAGRRENTEAIQKRLG